MTPLDTYINFWINLAICIIVCRGKFAVTQPVRTFQRLVNPEISLSCCQEPATELYNKTIESCAYLRYILILLYQQSFRRNLRLVSWISATF